MRTIFGLIFIAVAATLLVNGAKSIAFVNHPGGWELVGELVGVSFISLVLASIGLKWIAVKKSPEQAA
ncbi:MAG: hypothetical protein C0485_04970 [Pirellula sp.]|nr:hypothetical protein [Pirellula sp.]